MCKAAGPLAKGKLRCMKDNRQRKRGIDLCQIVLFTRRSFLAAGAAVGAAAAFGGVGVGGLRNEAFAWGEDHVVEYVATTCDGCGNKCGMGTWTQDGALWRFMGLENHPFAHGHLCVRGLGYTASAYSGGPFDHAAQKRRTG